MVESSALLEILKILGRIDFIPIIHCSFQRQILMSLMNLMSPLSNCCESPWTRHDHQPRLGIEPCDSRGKALWPCRPSCAHVAVSRTMTFTITQRTQILSLSFRQRYRSLSSPEDLPKLEISHIHRPIHALAIVSRRTSLITRTSPYTSSRQRQQIHSIARNWPW